MSAISIKSLKADYGISQEDITEAVRHQRIQRAQGVQVLSLAQILGVQGKAPRREPAAVTDLTPKQLRRRGAYGQAALIADQAALVERSPERATKAREASKILKELATPHQYEFDWSAGNVSLAHQYQDAVTERLYAHAPTIAKADKALAVLWQITRHLAWQSYECTKTAADLCDITRTDKVSMSDALSLLEKIGAIRRVKRGRSKIITVTPEGAFRGDVNKHAETVAKYRLDVIEGGRAND